MRQLVDALPVVVAENCQMVDQRKSEQVAEWLVTQTPRKVGNRIKEIAASYGIRFELTGRSEFPKQGGSRWICNGLRLGGAVENAEKLASEIELMLAPAEFDRIENWLVELHSICARRGDSELGHRVSLQSYATRLAGYPSDIVRFLLLEKTWKWFPSWHDMKAEADALLSQRTILIDRLKNIKPPESKGPELTAQERAAWVEKVNADIRAKADLDHPDVEEDMKAKAVLKEAADHIKAALAEN